MSGQNQNEAPEGLELVFAEDGGRKFLLGQSFKLKSGYLNAGGRIHRTIVIRNEYFDAKLQLLLLRTGLRQTILGLEPRIVDFQGTNLIFKRLGVKCDMLGVANDQIGYFLRVSDPAPCFVRTKDKTFISRARDAYLELAKNAQPFQKWAKTVGLAGRIPEIKKGVEAESNLIRQYAASWGNPQSLQKPH